MPTPSIKKTNNKLLKNLRKIVADLPSDLEVLADGLDRCAAQAMVHTVLPVQLRNDAARGECVVVVGGQYGSEGKGKVIQALLNKCMGQAIAVRCGGPNSGHTVYPNGKATILKQLPSAAAFPETLLCLPAGAVVDISLLCREIEQFGVTRERIVVDPRCAILQDDHRRSEHSLTREISSTGSGNGAALMARANRLSSDQCIMESWRTSGKFCVELVAPKLHEHLANGGPVLIEGNQGYGLSLLHGPHYPFTTSRDTTASGFASECGIGPLMVTKVVVVIRTFPIRVGSVPGGPGSGPLKGEIDWAEVARLGNWEVEEPEYTSVTKRLRRVGMFDEEMVRNAIVANSATHLAVMGLDRLCKDDRSCMVYKNLSDDGKRSIDYYEETFGIPVAFVGTSPSGIIDLDKI